jgi:hypothetical protein
MGKRKDANDDDRFVTLRIARDPVEAEMLRDVLEQEGIPATTQGAMHAQLLGAAGGVLSVPLQVPASMLEEARQIIDALDNFDALLPDGDDGIAVPADEMDRRQERLEQLEDGQTTGVGPYRAGPSELESSERGDTPDRRRKLVAGAVALILTFGSGHFYARDHRTGLVLALSELLALIVLLSGDPHGFYALLLLVSGDFLGGMAACDRANGAPSSHVMRAAPWLAMALVLGLVVTPWVLRRLQPETYLADETKLLCEQLDRCAPDGSYATPAAECSAYLRERLREGQLGPIAIDLCADCVAELRCEDLALRCETVCPVGLPR